MTLYYLGIGSNDQAEGSCRKMILALRESFGSLSVSSLIKTKAVGSEAADYLNAVVCFRSDKKSDELKLWCKSLENRLGRVRGVQNCRADLDILLSADEINQADVAQVTEHYYLSLLKQLTLFQSGEEVQPLPGSVALALRDDEIIGLVPAELSADKAACHSA